MPIALKLHNNDNVAVVLEDIRVGDVVSISDGSSVVARDDIPVGHKIALMDIGFGEPIIKYGEVIGSASRVIKVGMHVHIHNVRSIRLGGD